MIKNKYTIHNSKAKRSSLSSLLYNFHYLRASNSETLLALSYYSYCRTESQSQSEKECH